MPQNDTCEQEQWGRVHFRVVVLHHMVPEMLLAIPDAFIDMQRRRDIVYTQPCAEMRACHVCQWGVSSLLAYVR